MHIGHARTFWVTIFRFTRGWLQYYKEYYINDAGEQIKKLYKTILFHVENLLENSEDPLPDDLYSGNI